MISERRPEHGGDLDAAIGKSGDWSEDRSLRRSKSRSLSRTVSAGPAPAFT